MAGPSAETRVGVQLGFTAAGLAIAGPVGGIIGGGLGSALNSIWGSNDEAEAREEQARLMRMQAKELLARQDINEQIMREERDRQIAVLGSVGAATGRAGAGLGNQLATFRNVQRNIELSRREAEFKAKMLRSGAQVEMSLASDTRTAGYVQGVGTLVSSGAQAYSIYKLYGKGTTKGLF